MTSGGYQAPLLLSPLTMLTRIGTGAILCLFMMKMKVNKMMIDVTNYAIPDEYMVYMMIFAIVMGFLAAIGIRAYDHNRAADNKVANGTIPDTNSLPFDKRYDLCTASAFIVGSAAGMYVAPAVVQAVFIGAGMWTYCGITALLAGVFVLVLVRLFHFGVREFIIQAGKYAVKTSEAIKDAKEDIDEAIDNITEVIPDLNKH